MKLFYLKGSCSLSPRIILNEVGATAMFETFDRATKTLPSGKNYKEVNPKGSVPALQLDNGEILTEGPAIIQYIAETYRAYNLLPQEPNFTRYRVLEWLNYTTSELHKGAGAFFNPKIPEEAKKGIFTEMLTAKLDYVNSKLAGKDYLVNDEFTIADAYMFVVLSWMPKIGFDLTGWENLAVYVNKLKERPSIKKSLEQEEKS